MQFTPVPFKLLRVDYGQFGNERCHPDHGKPWANVPFDSWRHGDVVVVQYCQYWHVGWRFTRPSALHHKIALTSDGEMRVRTASVSELWRVTNRYQTSARALLGKTFTTREALEEQLL